jgi:uncharacterized protein with LGFP repeats
VRPRLRLLLAALVGLGVAGVFAVGSAPPQPDLTESADLRLFDAGNIIDDDVFYNASTMSAQQIQDHLTAKGGRCTGNCLKDHREDTWTRPADARCRGYAGAPAETAAQIIAKVAQSCGINPQVLIVMLQKEQGLVTGTPTATAYRGAMGFGCPDTAACDAQYYGFYNQVYSAANQLQRYRANPGNYKYRAGMTNTISYHPATEKANNLDNWRCGTASVYIRNQATAALYIYTPYVPNAAALANEYRTGDACSSYGNRNFFSYFTDWFGSTQSGAGSIDEKHAHLRASGVDLGAPTSAVTCDLPFDGCRRSYQGGTIFWHRDTGPHVVRGAILARYLAYGGPAALGYPTGDDTAAAVNPGFFSEFQHGAIYWSRATEARVVRGAILERWRAWGAQAGALGYPTGDDSPAPGGATTSFQGGRVLWSPPTGAQVVRGAILARFDAAGGTAGMGYPTGSDQPTRDGRGFTTPFQLGEIHWSAQTGAQVVRGAILDLWKQLGASGGYLGFPTTSDASAPGGGFVVDFQGGSLYWGPRTETKVVRGGILAAYRAAGGPRVLGYPTGHDQPTRDGRGWMTPFEYGEVHWSAQTGAQVVRGAILDLWKQLGASGGYLGFPVTSDASAPGGGFVVDFQGGSLYWGPRTETKVVRGGILAAYRAAGGPAALGYPTGHDQPTKDGRGWMTPFEYGEIHWSSQTGAQVVRGAILDRWRQLGGSGGYLGFPTTSDAPAPGGGFVVDFQGGSLYWGPRTETKVVRGEILKAYRAAGGPAALGYPTADERATADGRGYVTSFQYGEIYWSPQTGARLVRGAILEAYQRAGASGGYLGFPLTSDAPAPNGGFAVDFQGGSVYWSPATQRAHVVRLPLADTYRAQGGPGGSLGYPTTDTTVLPDGRQQVTFQGGQLTQ